MSAKASMRGLYGVRSGRTEDWYARQLAHAQACIAEADKEHTPEELAAARAALAVDPRSPQDTLFNAPPSRDLLPGEMPRPAAGIKALRQAKKEAEGQ